MANVFMVVRPHNDDDPSRRQVAKVTHALGRAGFDFIESHPLGVESCLKKIGPEHFLGFVLTGEGYGTSSIYLTKLAAQLPTAAVVWSEFLITPDAERFKKTGVKFMVEWQEDAEKSGIDWIGDPAAYARLIAGN